MSEKKRRQKAGQDKGKRNQARRRANAKPTGVRGNGSALAARPSDAADMQPGPERRRGAASVASRPRATANRAPTARRKTARQSKQGAGAHQEGTNAVQAGQTQRREKSGPQKDQPSSVNDHQKTVSGKKQHGPDEARGRNAGGNEGSKGQNVDARRSRGTGKQPGDIGDQRGRSRTKP
jgi:hypothetical protein